MSIVILLAPTPPPAGGIASWTSRMLEAELKNGWQVDIVDEKLIGHAETFGDNKKNYFNEVRRTISIWKNLILKLKNKNAKVVHSCIPSTTMAMFREYVCAVITHLNKRKFIIHYRCTVPNTTKGRIGNAILKALSKKSDQIIVLNTKSLFCIKEMCSTPADIIPNFVDISEVETYKDIKEQISTIVYVGGVIESKGCINICDVAKAFPEIEFRLIGKSSQYVESYSKNIKNVILTGPKSKVEVKEELKHADLFLFLSYFRGEGFSNALVEAMAAGLPCIVTDWAANKDMIGSEGGFVVEKNDIESAINAIKKIMPQNIRNKMSLHNQNKTVDYYSSKVVLDQYVDIYDALTR